MSTAKRKPRVDREETFRANYIADVEQLRRSGAFEPVVYPAGCGRCGGDLTVTPYPCPPERSSPAVVTKTINACAVCRVDRVLRWGDLANAARDAGLPYRGGLDTATMQHVPTARALAELGLIRYDRTDGAWELTPKGTDLLRHDDAEDRRVALEEWEARGQRFAVEHAELRERIDARFPATESSGGDRTPVNSAPAVGQKSRHSP